MPPPLAPLVAGRDWYRDAVGEAGCAVWRLHAAGAPDLYLKHGEGTQAGDVLDEAARLRWLAGRLGAPAVRHLAAQGDAAWLLTDAVPGRTAWQILDAGVDADADRGAVVDALADHLRALHRLTVTRCPFEAGHALRLDHARDRLAAGLIDEDDFDDAHDGWSAARLMGELEAMLPIAADRVVTHGDYSLDNILLADGAVTGCIDVGRLGVADRYQDIAILWNCLGEFESGLQTRFLSRYGIAEVDERRLRFHLMLDECF